MSFARLLSIYKPQRYIFEHFATSVTLNIYNYSHSEASVRIIICRLQMYVCSPFA